MTDDLTIRAATQGDIGPLTAIMEECMQHYFGTGAGGAEAAQALLGAGARSVETVIAFVGGEAVGFATFAVVYPGPEGRGTLYMKDLFVSGNARSRNLGRRLLTHLGGIAAARGCIRFDWTAETSNPRALAFYDRIGAARVAEKVYFRLEGARLQAFIAEGAE